MAQDIRDLLNEDKKLFVDKMPEGHEERFLEKLEATHPIKETKTNFSIWKIAATIVVVLGLGYGAFNFLEKPMENSSNEILKNENKDMAQLKTLGDISPALKKVEDYYMANINLELSSMDVTDDNRELFDGYIVKLEELNNEYKRLSKELTESGPNELTINALIDNLKFRLNLMYRLKAQLQDLNENNTNENKSNI